MPPKNDDESEKSEDEEILNIEFIESEGERSAVFKTPPTVFVMADKIHGGFAAQHLIRIQTLAFCKRFGYVYVHNPVSAKDYLKYETEKIINTHEEVKGWLDLWQYILNYNETAPIIKDIDYEIMIDLTKEERDLKTHEFGSGEYNDNTYQSYMEIVNYRKQYPKDRIIFVVNELPDMSYYSKEYMERFVKDLKESYDKTPGPSLYYNIEQFKTYTYHHDYNVVFHKRHKGKYKVNNDPTYKDIYVTTNEEIIRYIKGLNVILKRTLARHKEMYGPDVKQRNLRFWIFTDGEEEDFHQFKFHPKYNTLALIPDTDIVINIIPQIDSMKLFHHLVSADMLIMERCSFSYLAGLMCGGIVYYNFPYKYNKLQHWKDITMIEDEYESILEQKRRQVMNDDGTPNIAAISYVIEKAMKEGTAQVETTGTDSNGNPLSQEQINEIIKNTLESTKDATINVNGTPVSIPLPSPAQMQGQNKSLSIQEPVKEEKKTKPKSKPKLVKSTSKPNSKTTKPKNKLKSVKPKPKPKLSEIIEEEVINKPKKRGRLKKTND